MKLTIHGQPQDILGINVNAVLTGTVKGTLTLAGNPTQALEAAPKQYVDTKFNALSATNIKSGSLAAARIPVFTGDATVTAGTTVFTLSATGITAGAYTKTTVNTKGRITGGGQLVAADIPVLDWSKITTGKPTTAAGYGITDGLLYTGGTAVGTININNNPTAVKHAANKRYVDSKAAGVGPGYNIGDVITRPNTVTPSRFLRCNGGELSKTTYAALYAVVGDQYNFTTTPGSGKPWQQQYWINQEQTDDIVGWTAGTALPGALGLSQAIVTKNRVYLLGGYTGAAYTSVVYTAQINTDGTLGAWSTGTALPINLAYSQVITTKNRVYLLGGRNDTAYVATTYTAPINTDGTLGAWVAGSAIPGALGQSQAVVTKNRVYLLGGVSSAVVYTAPVNTDGTLGTWTTGTSLPGAFGFSQAIVTKNRVYLAGGNNGTSYLATVYTAPINTDGTLGAWTTGTALPAVLAYSQVIVTKNRAYLLGGRNASVYLNTVYTAPINIDGTLGAWSVGKSLPGVLGLSQAIVTKNRVYLLGGYNTAYTSVTYSAPIKDGLNDYSSYYDGTYFATTTGTFRIPDLSALEKDHGYYYIVY